MLTAGQMKRCRNILRNMRLPALHAENTTLLKFASLTLCSRHSKALPKMLKIRFISVRVTLHSVQESLSRWSLNFSASLTQTLSGLHTGKIIVSTGLKHLASKKMRCVCVTMRKKNFLSTAKQHLI